MQSVIGVNCPWCSHAILVIAPDLDRSVSSVVASKTWWCSLGQCISQLGCPSCQSEFFVGWNYGPPRPPARNLKVLAMSATAEQLRQISNRDFAARAINP